MARPSRLLTALGPDPHGPADADLVARFAADQDAAAFELLVCRHAPLVLRACRAVLRDRHAAEDAAQAVFLALARQARSVRGGTLAGWLFRVSRRVAARAASRRPPPAADVDPDTLPGAVAPPAADPAESRLLHEELARLPETYRAPVLLCYFEGLTRDEAARRLGWPAGTVAGRLARAKERLAARLARRGVAPAVLVVAVEVVPPSFAGAVTRAAAAYADGATGDVPAAVAWLVTQETRRTAMNKMAKVVGVALSLGVVAVGLGTAWGGDPRAAVQPTPTQPAPAPAPAPPKAVFGKGFVVAPVTTDLQRRLISRSGPSLAAYVSVDGLAVLPGGDRLAADALDMEALVTALRRLTPAPEQAVHADVYFTHAAEVSGPARTLVMYAVQGVGLTGRFGKSTSSVTNAHKEWAEFVAPLRDADGAAAGEAAVGDDKARAFPVRTPLSRVLTGGMAGVLEVRVRLDAKGGTLPDGVAESVRRSLRELRLPKDSRVHVLFNNPPTGGDAEADERLRRWALDWAAAEGLVGGTHTTGG